MDRSELHNKVIWYTITLLSSIILGSMGLALNSVELFDIISTMLGKGMIGFTKFLEELLNASLFVTADVCILAMDSKDNPPAP